jgi:phytoene dehydrogenase-like protein
MKYRPKVYDVIVLGAGLSGLIAANRLTNENRSVLLLKEERHRPSYTREGYRFFPFSNLSEKRIKTGHLKKISHLLDLPNDRKKGGQSEQNVSFQIVLPESRIDLYRDSSLLQREWRREFQQELKQIEFFYSELRQIKGILNEIKTMSPSETNFPVCNKSFLKRWLSFDGLPGGGTDQRLSSFSPEFKKFIELQMISYGYLCSDVFPLSLVSHLLVHDDGDAWAEGMDLEILRQGMISKFIRSGGSIKEVEGVVNLEMKRRGDLSLSIKGEDATFRCRTLLLSSPLHRLSGLLDQREKSLSKWGKRIRPRYIMVPCFLGIHERVIPVGMRNLLVSLFNLQKPYENGNLLFISLSRKGDERQAPESKRALTVHSFMPFEESKKNSISGLQEGVINHLKHLFPFLENYIEFIDWKWAEDQMDCWSYPHYYDEVDSEFQWRRGIVPIRISKQLYFAGKENFPYLGLEGMILSGLLCGEKVSKRLN